MSEGFLSSSPIDDSVIPYHRHNSNPTDVDGDHAAHTSLRPSPTLLSRSFDPQDARERQLTMDVDMAMHLSRARRETISMSPDLSMQQHAMHHRPSRGDSGMDGFDPDQHRIPGIEDEDGLNLATAVLTDNENNTMPSSNMSRIDLTTFHHLAQGHDPSLLASSAPQEGRPPPSAVRAASTEHLPPPHNESTNGPPTYQATNVSGSLFDFSHMEDFAATEKASLGLSPTTKFSMGALRRSTAMSTPPPASDSAGPSTSMTALNQQPTEPSASAQEPAVPVIPTLGNIEQPTDEASPRPTTSNMRHRKLSQSHPHPRLHRKGIGGKIALFETPHISSSNLIGIPNGGPSTLSARLGLGGLGIGRQQQDGSGGYDPLVAGLSTAQGGGPGTGMPGGILTTGHDRPYRFSFYSNSLAATIHARSLSELPAEGQSFEDLFFGIHPPLSNANTPGQTGKNGGTSLGAGGAIYSRATSPGGANSHFPEQPGPNNGLHQQKRFLSDPKLMMGPGTSEPDEKTWWLDVLSPTDEEMKMLSKVFSIHPLTTEDILMEETREKIELFRNYYLVCFRSFDQDPYSPTYLEPLNKYIIVFREGILSFHFRPTPHPQNVRRRIKQLKDYISVTSDWISYALIDDITDAFGPLIQSIEYEVDSIDELVLILKETEQSDMLRRIGTCRKKVMGLLRLMGNKADVVKGLAKRCNENWRVAPTSDIGLYLSDIQDHLITMTQNLNHYEKILSRSHSNYLAQISIEMTDANNQINDVLSKLTALGTILIPMNLVTGLWGMNVHVPGQDVQDNYHWFISIIAGLAAFAAIGGYSTYRFLKS